MYRRHFIKGAISLPLLSREILPAFSAPAFAQTDWPTRNITMIVPFPAGGQADIAARPIAAALERTLQRAVVVDNRAGGAGGSVGNAAAARSAPDGYTLLMTLASLSVLPEADRLFGRQPAYEVSQLEPVARIIGDPFVLAVGSSAPWKSAQEFIADAKKRPGMIPYGSSGPYGVVHVAMEMLSAAAGIKLLHVPFRGGGPAFAALLSETVPVLALSPGIVKAHVDAGKVRILANWGAERMPSFPDVPTLKEIGYPDVEFFGWAGLFAPRGVPTGIMTRLRDATRQAMSNPEVLKVFETGGSLPAYLDAPEFARFLETDNARLVRVVQKIGKVE